MLLLYFNQFLFPILKFIVICRIFLLKIYFYHILCFFLMFSCWHNTTVFFLAFLFLVVHIIFILLASGFIFKVILENNTYLNFAFTSGIIYFVFFFFHAASILQRAWQFLLETTMWLPYSLVIVLWYSSWVFYISAPTQHFTYFSRLY